MDEQQLQQQIIQLVQAAMQGDQLATQQIQQIMLAAQQGDQQAGQLAQMIQAVAQQMQGQQVQAAKFGAKLNYIRRLRGLCPEGYEMQYFRQGGQLCKKCMKKQQRMEQGGVAPSNPIDAFKCGRKMKKKRCEIGGTVEMDKCGSKMKKSACGSKIEQDKCGSKLKKKVKSAKGGTNTKKFIKRTSDLYTEGYGEKKDTKPTQIIEEANPTHLGPEMMRYINAPGDTIYLNPNPSPLFIRKLDPGYAELLRKFNILWNHPSQYKKK